jgi:hypothetical protein
VIISCLINRLIYRIQKENICSFFSCSGFVQDRWRPVQVGGRGQTSLCLEANNVVVLNDQTASISPHAVSFQQK